MPEQPATLPEEIVEFDENVNDMSNALVTYSLDHRDDTVSKPDFCPELGLAIEKLRDGYTVKNLWEVVPTQIMQNAK